MSARSLQELVLLPYDVQTPAWKKLTDYYRAVLQQKRNRLESTGATHEERSQLCWEIGMIKRLLAHGEAAEKNVAGAG